MLPLSGDSSSVYRMLRASLVTVEADVRVECHTAAEGTTLRHTASATRLRILHADHGFWLNSGTSLSTIESDLHLFFELLFSGGQAKPHQNGLRTAFLNHF
jgi:hypothetical protein